jgi:DNA repair protein RadD
MILLRDYQQSALDQLYAWFRVRKFDGDAEHNPLVVAPTGSGKSLLLAQIVKDALTRFGGERVLILTHQKELIEQNHAKLVQLLPGVDAGIHSASIGLRHTRNKVIFAGIQSVADKAGHLGRFGLILVDECHLISQSGQGRYRRLIEDMRKRYGKQRVVGFTATPYRLHSGMLHQGEGRIFTDIAVDIPIQPLIDAGHLAPLVNKRTGFTVDMEGVKKRGSEYVIDEAARAMMDDGGTRKAIEDAAYRAQGRKSWIVFCCTVEHAGEARYELSRQGIEARVVTGETPLKERAALLNAFRQGDLAALVNVGVLTTGFDAPRVDCIVLLRPTESTGLYIQMLGRGMRPSPGKTDCLVLDYAGNIYRHGPVDAPEMRKPGKKGEPAEAPVKVCPECEAIVHARLGVCACGHEFPPPKPQVTLLADEKSALLKSQIKPEWFEVSYAEAFQYQKPGSEYPVLRVEYYNDDGPWPVKLATEFVCLFHPEGSWARKKAETWAIGHDLGEGFEVHHPPSRLLLDTSGKYPAILDKDWKEHADAA